MDTQKHLEGNYVEVDTALVSTDISLDLVDVSVNDKSANEPAVTDLLEGFSSLNFKQSQEEEDEFDLPPPPPPSILAECSPEGVETCNAVTVDDLLGGDLVETDLPPPPPSLLPVAAELLPSQPEPNMSSGAHLTDSLLALGEPTNEDGPVTESLIDIMMIPSDIDPCGPSGLDSATSADKVEMATQAIVMSSDMFLSCNEGPVQSKGDTEPLSPKTDDSGFEPEASPTENQTASSLDSNEGHKMQQDQVGATLEDEDMTVPSIRQNEEQEDDFEFEVPSPTQNEPDLEENSQTEPIPSAEDMARLEAAGAELVATALTSAVMMCQTELEEANPRIICMPSESDEDDCDCDCERSAEPKTVKREDTAKMSTVDTVTTEPEDISESSTKLPQTEVSAVDISGQTEVASLQANGLVANAGIDGSDQQKTSELKAAEDEWAQVETVTPAFDEEGAGKVHKPTEVRGTPIVSFNEAIEFCKSADMQQYQGQVKVSVSRSGFAALKHVLFGPPKLHRDLHSERLLAFCIAASPFNNEELMHIHVLQTIYKKLTGSKFDCQRFGGHWEQIGFQGQDPATDLRGTGFLGLVNLLYLVSNPRILPLARDVYRLSQHESQNFPFCIMGINMSRLAIQAMREDCLNKECNRRKQVLEVLNDFYVGAYYHLYSIWKHQHKTIADSGYVIKEVETFAKKNPRALLKNLEAHLQQRAAQSKGGSNAEGEPLNFADLEDVNN